MASLLESVGAQPKNKSLGKPLMISRWETGLATNRNPLHDPAQFVVSKFYGGYIDVAWDGDNMELSNQLTWIRRPGLSEWSTVAVPDQPNWFYDWRTLDCGIEVVVDTPTSTYIQTSSTQTLIFTKSAGAGQGYYQGVADTLYYGDGIDLQQFILGTDCILANGKVFNWGIIGPTTAPTLVITESASAAVQWQASTVFATMGLAVDNHSNIQQLIGVNNSGSQFGETGSGAPAWNQTPGGTTTDGGATWTNWGPIVLRQDLTTYNNVSVGGTLINPCIIYDPPTACCFVNINPSLAQGTTGASRPAFSAAPGSIVHDGSVKWLNLGTLKTPPSWQPSHTYSSLGSVANDYSVNGISEPTNLSAGLPTGQVIYWQVNNTGSPFTSSTGGTSPFAATEVAGDQTADNQLTWLCLGSETRQTTHAYGAWSAQGTIFGCIVDSNGNYQVCTTTGVTSATATASVPWATGYNQTTVDGTVTWTCVGPDLSWAVNTIWYLPTSGWFPPGGAVQYGGALVTDTNGDLEAVIASGLSQTPGPPSWPAFGSAPATPTTDGGITWALVGPATSTGFSWTKGMSYAYSYTSRTATDQYNYAVGTIVPAFPDAVWAGAPPDWPSPLGPPTGSGTGHVSTASPLATITGPNPGATVTLTIPRSTDPQVDTITIWRTLDGGSTLFFLTEVPNPPASQPFQVVQDISPDSVINEFIEAPIAGQNNPPPAGFLPMAYHFQRIWGAVGNFVYASGGPDVLTGDPNQSFDPLDFFEFPEPVTRIVPTATGILVFLSSDVYAILGGPIFDTFFATPMVPGVGLLHYNALDIHGGVTYLFTADRQFISMDPSGGAQRMGGLIADKLQNFDPTKVYVTVHESGNDNAIFISDGSTGWYRLNPAQFPNGAPVWSTFATITGGAGAVLSIEVTQGVHRLLVGGIGANTHILQRDFSTYEDNGTPYTCFTTIGSLNAANPGQIAGLTFVNLRATRVGTAPTVSFLLNEVSGSFTAFPDSQPYPWQIYGTTGDSTSLYTNAYYFRDAGIPALAEHLQVKFAFPAENFANEVLSMTLFGVIEQAPEE